MNPSGATLLVVDDNEDNRYTLTRRLARAGYTRVVTANDGQQGLDALREQRIDLMLLDIMMPGMDGYEVLRRIKADERLRDVPVIMISAVDEVESVVRCVELGAEDYLPKPFNPTLLRARVGASLEKKQLRDEVRASLARLQREMDAARSLQLGMLPSGLPATSPPQRLQVSGHMEPAREVGGDLYDFFHAPGGLFCFLIGDVSGKGAGAAMFMARTRSLARLAVVELLSRVEPAQRTPAFIAEVLNRELSQDNRQRMFVTLFMAFLDVRTGAVAYINAGHPSPYVLRADGSLDRLPGKSQAPLAVRAVLRYENHAAELREGDVLCAFTDGVVEATNESGELYSAARLEACLLASAGASAEAVVQGVKLEVDAFVDGAEKADDVTLLAVRFEPQPAAGGTAQLVIANDIAQVARLRDALARIGEEHGIEDRALFQLHVALDEVSTNVIKYAWPGGGSHELRVTITVGDGLATIAIIDDGVPFDPLAAPAPPALQPGQKPKPGGLGIHMLKQIVDSVEYARVEGRNHLTITKKCGASRQ